MGVSTEKDIILIVGKERKEVQPIRVIGKDLRTMDLLIYLGNKITADGKCPE